MSNLCSNASILSGSDVIFSPIGVFLVSLFSDGKFVHICNICILCTMLTADSGPVFDRKC